MSSKNDERMGRGDRETPHRDAENLGSQAAATLSRDFRLYCDREWLRSVSQSMVFVGCFCGTLLGSVTAERVGRKWSNAGFWIVNTLGVIVIATADPRDLNGIYQVMAGYFLGGFGNYPCTTAAYVILSEQSQGVFRSVTTGYALIGYSITEFWMDWAAYALGNNWQQLSLYALTLPMLAFVVPNFFLVESPRYFLSLGDKPRALTQFNAYARVNGRSALGDEALAEYQCLAETRKYTFLDLFRYASVRVQVLSASYVKFVLMFVMYGTNFAMNQFGFGVYTNQLLVAVAEISSYALYPVAIKYVRRRVALGVLAFCFNLFCVLFVFFPVPDSCKDDNVFCAQKYLQISSFCVARFCSSLFFAMLSMYYPEIFPTSIRGMATMFIRAVGVSGSILSPYVVQGVTLSIGDSAPVIVLGLVGMTSLIPFRFLKETWNVPFEDQIAEVEAENALLAKNFASATSHDELSF